MLKKKKFHHVSGGCVVRSGCDNYPCDDTYESSKQVLVVISTREAHYKMPDEVDNALQMRKLRGVKSVKVHDKKKYYG